MVTSTEFSPTLFANRWFFLPADVVIRTIWQARFRIIIITMSFTVLGILIALVQQPEFRSEARIIPEMNTGASDLFKRLSSMAGFVDVDFSDAEDVDAVRPDLYPNVLQSTPFILFLIDQSVHIKGQPKTVGQFLVANHTSWSWKQLVSFDKQNEDNRSRTTNIQGPVYLSAQQQELAEEISERVNAKLDTRSGIITITVKMPDAQVAASVTQLALNYLTRYVTAYRTKKAREDLTFYDRQLDAAHQRYQTAQSALFQYNDNHKAIAMQVATVDRHRMETELTIAQTVYTELSRRFEQAKLKVQERTPIFNVLEPPKVPLKRISPRRMLTVLLSSLAGLVISVLVVLIQQADLAGRLKAIVAEDTYCYEPIN
ncbi:lipopolysaccharide biosynthesis protein [Spirosoma sp. HMF4905]|uniref:Lipopolysaccharide biosynthesis protein n=1 Tax=Spirosoma arboris TaxID=2682092 RepID=A0A7K1S696_9BACT|nr:Wzz/FepE/Etk N-terminal domain-containing protein [Spirosoma arboris]MVM29265.1 lipopolysaccharide biosynthesis protein [Spirosoma arboris]